MPVPVEVPSGGSRQVSERRGAVLGGGNQLLCRPETFPAGQGGAAGTGTRWVRDPHVLVTHFHRSIPCLSLCCPCRSLTPSVFTPRLFKIDLGPPKKLEELDPDSIEYWRRLRKYNMWHRNRLKKGKKL